MPGGGNLGRNTFRGPGFEQWNFSLSKAVKLRERLAVTDPGGLHELVEPSQFPESMG